MPVEEIQKTFKEKFLGWLKGNYQGIIAGLLCGALAFGSVGYACGFVKGCQSAEKKSEQQR